MVLSCRKVNDAVSPVISVDEPVEGSVYKYNDTIWISGKVFDESGLKSVKVSLLDKDTKPVLGSQVFNPATSEYKFFTGIPINDIHLAGGIYSIQIKAFDGINFSNAYINIVINEFPRELKSIVLISKSGNYGTDISTISSAGDLNKVLTLAGDLKSSCISSYDQIVFTAGALSGDLNAVLLPQGSVLWQVPLVSSPPYRYFEDLFFASPCLYAAYYNGFIYGYNKEGIVVYSTGITTNYFPEHIEVLNNHLICSLKSKTGQESMLAVYYLASGSMMQSVGIPATIIAFEALDSDNILVFCNQENTGMIYEYSISQNKLRFRQGFNDGKIMAVTKKDNENFFISGEQTVHWYIPSTNTLTGFLTGKPKALIDFDEVNQRLYVLSNHNLSAFELYSSQAVFSLPLEDSVLALHLLYNK